MAERTFVLGLGAQKAGTSWLHGYLASFPFADFGLLKEYHVWDALRIAPCREFLATWRDFVSLRRGWVPVPDRGAMLRRRLQREEGAWERHFAGLASRFERRHPDAPRFLTGDITPAYSGLGPGDLAEIRRRIEGEGFAVKAVFLMRDPVERCWSAVRMMHRNARSQASEEAALRSLFATPDYEFRTRYDRTIAAIESCFAPGEVLYAIYEELFARPTLERIGAFLDLPVDEAFASRQFNASPKRAAISDDLKAAIRAHYAPVYAFCRDRFPEVEALWDMGGGEGGHA